MNNKKITNTLIIVIAIALIGTGGYLATKTKSPQVIPIPLQTTPPETLEYINTQYGFSFSLPTSWQGYSIVTMNWEGNMIDVQNSGKVQGPEILIRHPLWTKDVPRQDIPIMILTTAQWDLISQDKLSVSAAPIPPSELGHNANYVFALPARYNYAFPVG